MAMLPDLRPLHRRACERFVDLVRTVEPTDWSKPTPCSEWNVRTVVDHVVRWNTYVPEFLAGRTLPEIVASAPPDALGDNPQAAANESARTAIAAFEAPGALERVVHHPFGDMSGAQIVFLRLFDLTVHGWDVARGLGQNFSMDKEIAEVLYAGSLAQKDVMRASGHFGPAEVPVAEGADTQTRLLGLLGRAA